MPGQRKRERLARRAHKFLLHQQWRQEKDEEYMRSLAPTRWQQVWVKICIILELMFTNFLQGFPALDGYDWSMIDISDLIQ